MICLDRILVASLLCINFSTILPQLHPWALFPDYIALLIQSFEHLKEATTRYLEQVVWLPSIIKILCLIIPHLLTEKFEQLSNYYILKKSLVYEAFLVFDFLRLALVANSDKG